jgi:hypothetical protein
MIAEKMMQRITREDREKEFEQERKEGRLHLLPRRGRAWEGVRNRWRSMAELEAWLDDVERRTRFPLAVAEPLHAAPVETWDTVRGPVRSPVRGVDVSSVDTPVTVESFVEITTTAGTDASAVSGNQITVPAGSDGVMVWIEGRSMAELYLELSVKVDATTKVLRTHRYQRVIVQAAAGAVVSFASRSRVKTSHTLEDSAALLKVSAHKEASSLTAPTGVTGTAHADRSGFPLWEPTAPHIVMNAKDRCFQINAVAYERDILIAEFDENGGASYGRHVYVPANETRKVECHFRNVALAIYDPTDSGTDVSITAPTGTQIGGTSVEFRFEFTPSLTISVPSGDEAAFKAAMNNASDNVDVVIEPGPMDLSGSGLPMNSTNYATAITKNRRVRSATGNPADVVFSGSGWSGSITVGKAWILEAFSVDMTGQTGLQLGGAVHGWKIKISGAPTGTSNPTLGIIGSSALGVLDVFWVFCDFRDATEDLVDVTQTNGQGAGETVGHVVACVLNGNGNGSGGNGQILTSHLASVVAAWGCKITDTTNATRQSYLVPDSSSFLFCFFCESLAADIAYATVGINIRANGLFFCRFDAVQQVYLSLDSGWTASGGYVVGGRMTQRVTSGVAMFPAYKTDIFAYVAGVTIVSGTASGCDVFHARASIEIDGVDLTMGATSTSSRGIRASDGSPAAGTEVRLSNSRFRCATSGARPIELGTSANLVMVLYNNVFENTLGTFSWGASGSTTGNVAENNFFPTNAFATNFATRFPDVGSITAKVDGALNYWSATDSPGIGADGTPAASGLSDTEGKDLGHYAGLDRYGRILRIGGAFVRGPVEIQALKSSRILSPEIW